MSTNHEAPDRAFVLTSCLLGPNVFLSTLASDTRILCSSSVRDEVSHPSKTRGKN